MKKVFILVALTLCIISIYSHPRLDLSSRRFFDQNKENTRIDSLHGFDVISYYVDIEIDDQENYIEGYVQTELLAQENLEYVEYNLVGLEVESVLIDGVNANYTYENDIISIPVDVENNQQFTSKVFYSGYPQLSDDGYNIGMVFRPNMVFTISDPNATRNWFPCYDHPWDKAIVSFNVTCRDDWVAACNGLQGQTIDNGDGTKSYEWLGENPMSTYLAVIHIAPYSLIEQTFTKENGQVIPIQHFVQNNIYEDCLVDFERVPEMMQAYSDAYGEYPFEKYGQAIVNMQTYGAMEHQTMTTLGVSYIDGSPNDPEYTVAHELSHHWFGNCLTPFTWKDVWLSEGFATYSEAVWANYLLGYDAMIEYVNINIQNYYKNWQNSAGPQVIYDPEYLEYFTPPSYEKAASVLHMLRLELGDEVFWNMIQTWYAENQYGNIVTEEFIAHCQDISGLDLSQFFEQWIYSSGIPSYEYAVLRNPETNQIKFYNNVTSDSGNDFYLTIPFHLGQDSDSLRTVFTPGFSMTPAISVSNVDLPVHVDPDSWNLIEGSQELTLEMISAYAGDGQALITWNSFANEEDFAGYKLYMKEVTESQWTLVNQEVINARSYLVDNLENGIDYHFYVVIVDATGFESYPTNSLDMIVTPQAIEASQSILIIDDSADGIGALLSPSDQEIDNYYNNMIFQGYQVSNLDLNQEELTYPVLADYDVVIWHNDTVSSSDLPDYENMLGNYLLSGGKLVISGWKTVLDLSPSFLELFMGVTGFELYNSPIMNSAQSTSDLYPDLVTDSSLLPGPWNGNISMITSFEVASASELYTISDPEAIVAVTSGSDNTWETYFFGFPLYYFNAQEVRTMMLSILSNTNPPVDNENNEVELAQETYMIYPNPVGKDLNIQSNIKSDKSLNITLYNIRGQKVLTENNSYMKNGLLRLSFAEKKLANGVYFIKISSKDNEELRKLLILK
jgi:hypothetical protein